MNYKDLQYYLALQKIKGIGAVNAKKLISHLGSAEAVFKAKASELSGINGIGTHLIQQLQNKDILAEAAKEVRRVEQEQIDFTLFTDKSYPKLLNHCIDSPLVLFSMGNIAIATQPVISIVGTRSMTSYGRHFLDNFVADLAPYNPIIVSGFAYGVDITAHKAAIKHNLQTIAVLGHGLGQIYPKAHKKYMQNVLANGGFFTEHWYDEAPLREHFLQRNRVIAGLADATVIIESASKGGSLVTANIANSYNRDVFALPGRVSDTYSAGCNNLIRTNKAQLLNSAQDLVYFLNLDQQNTTQKTIQPQLFLDLNGEEQLIYDYLKTNGKMSSDELALALKIPIYKISGILLELELKGVIKPLPGKQFELSV